METAKIWGMRQTCPRANVGTVIEKEGRIISIGYGGSPSKSPHCFEVGCFIDPSLGEGCHRTLHAESNAICFAAKYGISTIGCTMYTTLSPCYKCAQNIVAAGICRVVYLNLYRDTRGIEYLKRNGVSVWKFNPKFYPKGGDTT